MSVYLIDQYQNKRLSQKRCSSMSWKEKSSTLRAFQAHDTWFYWSSKNALQERFIAEWWRWVWMEALQLTTQLNPCPPDQGIFCSTSFEGRGLLQPPPWIFFTERLIPLHVYLQYGPPLSIDTKMSTTERHMTSLWLHKVRAPSEIWMHWKYTWKLAEINFSLKNRRNVGFLQNFWLNLWGNNDSHLHNKFEVHILSDILDFTNPSSTILFDDPPYPNDTP